MKNSDVINKILKYHPQFPGNYAGCDGYKFGDPNAECNGIATALVPTVDVIRRTGELGCNLLVVHEPIFYSTEDYPDWRAGGKNSVYEEKKALLDKYGITVWRDHDHMHAHNPDSIFTGVIKYLGWENYYIPSEKSSIKVPMGYLFELPETTVKELGQYLEDKLGMNGLRIVGNPDDKIRKVAIVGHLFPGFGTQSESMMQHTLGIKHIWVMVARHSPNILVHKPNRIILQCRNLSMHSVKGKTKSCFKSLEMKKPISITKREIFPTSVFY